MRVAVRGHAACMLTFGDGGGGVIRCISCCVLAPLHRLRARLGRLRAYLARSDLVRWIENMYTYKVI